MCESKVICRFTVRREKERRSVHPPPPPPPFLSPSFPPSPLVRVSLVRELNLSMFGICAGVCGQDTFSVPGGYEPGEQPGGSYMHDRGQIPLALLPHAHAHASPYPLPPTVMVERVSAFCSHCGHPLLPGAVFCSACGHPVRSTGYMYAPSAPFTYVSSEPQPPPPAYTDPVDSHTHTGR
jgi:hypothetical protein